MRVVIHGILAHMWRRAVALLICLALSRLAGAGSAERILPGADLAHFFPSAIYAQRVRGRLRETALTSWPGPTALVDLWSGGSLGAEGRVVLLLGAGFFHDRQLLPVYEAGIGDRDPRVRQAAAAGYRELVGDLPPRLEAPVSDEQAHALLGEMEAMSATLRQRPLVAVWLDALLHTQGESLPGPRGIVLERPATYCLEVVDRLAGPEDLPLVAAAYPLVRDLAPRLGLIRVLEGLTMRRLVDKPSGPRAGWGEGIWEAAQQWTWGFLSTHCQLDAEDILRRQMAALGVPVQDPFSAAACPVWWRVLERGESSWWGLAADRIYSCGGPAVAISRVRADEKAARSRREYLLNWYEPTK